MKNSQSALVAWRGMFALAAFTLTSALSFASDNAYQEQGGIVAIEFEDQAPASGWVSQNSFVGFSGTEYYRWQGGNFFTTPGNGIISYTFNVTGSGTWQLLIHNRHENSDSSEENDVWVSMDNGSWKKVYSNLGSSTSKVWNWHTRFDNGSSAHTDALYTLSPGNHTIRFSGRSDGFAMDRFHIARTNNPNKTNINYPADSCDDATGPATYCVRKANSLGCLPEIAFTGAPSMTSSTAFNINGARFLNNKAGLLFYGYGENSVPFMGGTLCVLPPLVRTDMQFSFGNAGTNCSGTYSFDFNDWIQTGPDFNIMVGSDIFSQYWARDPQGVAGSSLSGGLQFTVGN